MAKKTGMGSTPLSWVRDTRTEDADVSGSDTGPPTEKPTQPKKQAPARKRSGNRKPRAKRQSEAESRSVEVQKPKTIAQSETVQEDSEVQKLETSEVAKFETFEVKLSVLLRNDQLEFLERLVREIMGSRGRDCRKERITKNTVVRVCLDVLQGVGFDRVDISDEEELLRRVRVGAGGA